MKRGIVGIIAVFIVLLASEGLAADRLWGDHASPFTFQFGNHIDTHQETALFPTDGKGKQSDLSKGDLLGWFYVYDSGTVDDATGLPVLKHCTTDADYVAGCVAAWSIHAKVCIDEVNGCRAMNLYHYHDHPVWFLDPHEDETGTLRGARQHLPQPGTFTHFHWLTDGTLAGYPSSLAALEALFGVTITIPAGCNKAMASEITPGSVCPGYFLEIAALQPFGYGEWTFEHEGEHLVVRPGVDAKTHTNFVTSYPVTLEEITGP